MALKYPWNKLTCHLRKSLFYSQATNFAVQHGGTRAVYCSWSGNMSGITCFFYCQGPDTCVEKKNCFRLNLIFFFSFCLFPYLFSTAEGGTYFSVQTGKVMIQRDGKCSLYVAEFLFVIGVFRSADQKCKLLRRIQDRTTGRLSCLSLIILILFL